MQNGSQICYHKFLQDDMRSFKQALKNYGINDNEIKSIKLYGGNLDNFFRPRGGNIITTYAYNNIKGKLKFNGIKEKLTHSSNQVTPYSGKIFMVNDSGEVGIIGSYLLYKIPFISDIISTQDSARYDAEISNQIEKLKLTPNYMEPNGSKMYSFVVTKINQFCGYRNREEIIETLERAFPNKQISDKITYQYVPLHSNLVIDNDKASLPQNIPDRYFYDHVDADGSSISSGSQTSLYNNATQIDKKQIQTIAPTRDFYQQNVDETPMNNVSVIDRLAHIKQLKPANIGHADQLKGSRRHRECNIL